MIFCKYTLATGLFLCAWPNAPDFDPATEGVAALVVRPDLRRHRYDEPSPNHLRLATAQELLAYDEALLDKIASEKFDHDKDLKACMIWTAQQLSIPLAQARQEILAIRRTL